jgi:hypothetical protein
MTGWNIIIAGILLVASTCSVVAQQPPVPAQGPATATVIASNCVIIKQNVTLGQNATLIDESDCNPDDPTKRYTIRYIWLDSRRTSYLMADYFDENLKRIFATNPKLIKNDIHKTITEIIERFGNTDSFYMRRPEGTALLGIKGSTKTVAKVLLENLPERFRNKLRIYFAEESIPWPDLPASTAVRDTLGWPAITL